jgi:hypothetical protein
MAIRNNHNSPDGNYPPVIFAIVSIALLAADRYAENNHLKESEVQ